MLLELLQNEPAEVCEHDIIDFLSKLSISNEFGTILPRCGYEESIVGCNLLFDSNLKCEILKLHRSHDLTDGCYELDALTQGFSHDLHRITSKYHLLPCNIRNLSYCEVEGVKSLGLFYYFSALETTSSSLKKIAAMTLVSRFYLASRSFLIISEILELFIPFLNSLASASNLLFASPRTLSIIISRISSCQFTSFIFSITSRTSFGIHTLYVTVDIQCKHKSKDVFIAC